MAETFVETKYCEACGADVRPGSLFCYNCGGAVSDEGRTYAKDHPGKDDSSQVKNDFSGNNNRQTTKLKNETLGAPVIRPIEKPISEPLNKSENKPLEKTSIHDEAKLKSAANLRRKAKIYQKKRVEVVWEEPEDSPNKWFPIVAIVLILFVIGIFYLAMYLK